MKELPTMNTTAFYYVHEAQDHVLEKYYSSETEQTTNDVKFEIVRKHSGKLEMVSIFLLAKLKYVLILVTFLFTVLTS